MTIGGAWLSAFSFAMIPAPIRGETECVTGLVFSLPFAIGVFVFLRGLGVITREMGKQKTFSTFEGRIQ
jgi:hypothetical protein